MAANPLPPSTPAPIPTIYKGIKYRSKLEAQWARTLDLLEVPVEYEPEARWTEHGGYLPDFYLPRMKGGTWVELKPFDSLGLEDPRWVEFALQRGQRLIAVFGLRDPYEGIGADRQGVGLCIYPSGEIDYEYHLTACAVCGNVGLEFQGRGARACSDRKVCYGRLDADRAHNADDHKLLAALVDARGYFVGMEHRAGRALPDNRIDELAKMALAQEKEPGGLSGWISKLGLSPADREAVLRAWGRLTD